MDLPPIRSELSPLRRLFARARDHLTGVWVVRDVFVDSQTHEPSLVLERWRKKGHVGLYRADGPAMIEWRIDGSIANKKWFLDGRPGCAGEPAEISYDEDGAVRRTRYIYDKESHRLDGPAIIGGYRAGWRYLGKEVTGVAEVGALLLDEEPARTEELLRASRYRVFLDSGVTAEKLATILAAGVGTHEGIRQVLDGTPVEWVVAFDDGEVIGFASA